MPDRTSAMVAPVTAPSTAGLGGDSGCADGLPRRKGTLIFLHIPKTAGTTFNRILEAEYNPFRIHTLSPQNILGDIERFKRLSESRKRWLDVLKGHMQFGLHEYLPNPAAYITFLRDPVDRAVSAFFFIREHRLHPMHREIKDRSIEDFIRATPSQQNVQTKLIGGLTPDDECTLEVLQRAQHNLRNSFSVIGITERFGESLAAMRRKFGWKLKRYRNYRVTSVRPASKELPGPIVESIRRSNAYDVELYELALRLFEQQLSSSELPENAAEIEDSFASPRSAGGRLIESAETLGRAAITRLASAF